MIADQKYQAQAYGEVQDEKRASIPEEGGNYINVNKLLQQPTTKAGAIPGRNHRQHKTDFSKTDNPRARKIALINENIAEAGRNAAHEMTAKPSIRELAQAKQQKYQNSQLIKTEDKILRKLIAFSLSQQTTELGESGPPR